MEENEEGLSEQRIIENYLQEFRLEDCIDEIINQVVVNRPPNPYLAIASGFESKTLPEILDVKFVSVFSYGSFAVKATLVTNLGSFSAIAPYTIDASNLNLEPKDYTVINGKMKEALIPINPINFKHVEEAILGIQDVDPAESLALSIAAIRAASKFKGQSVCKYISELSQTKDDQLCIPAPVPVIATFSVPSTNATKLIQLFPVKSSTLDSALVKLNQLFNRVLYGDKSAKPIRISQLGTPWIDSPTLEDLCKNIVSVIRDADEESNFKIGLHQKGDQCLKPSEPNAPAQQYFTNAAALKTGQEVIEQFLPLWTELDMVSVDNMVAAMDLNSWRHLKKRVPEIVFEARNGGDKLKYCGKGIGNDASCNLQVPLDGNFLLTVSVQDMEKQLLELPYNAVKINFSNNINSISKALDICDRAKKLNLPIIIDTTTLLSRNHYSSPDTFESDFAVGVGAVQFYGNGFYDTNYLNKISRLQEIERESENQIPYIGGKFRTGPIV